MAEDLVQVQGDGVLGDQTFDLVLQVVGQNPHQSLGGEAILGALLVVAWRWEKRWLRLSMPLLGTYEQEKYIPSSRRY